MKRLLAFLILCATIGFISPYKEEKIFDNKDIVSACVISKYERQFEDCQKVIKSGSQFYYYGEASIIKKEYKNFDEIDGIVLYFENDKLEEIKRYYKTDCFEGQKVFDYQIFYGYSPFYKKSNMVEGKVVNIQIVVTESEIIVGFPIVLTGY